MYVQTSIWNKDQWYFLCNSGNLLCFSQVDTISWPGGFAGRENDTNAGKLLCKHHTHWEYLNQYFHDLLGVGEDLHGESSAQVTHQTNSCQTDLQLTSTHMWMSYTDDVVHTPTDILFVTDSPWARDHKKCQLGTSLRFFNSSDVIIPLGYQHRDFMYVFRILNPW